MALDTTIDDAPGSSYLDPELPASVWEERRAAARARSRIRISASDWALVLLFGVCLGGYAAGLAAAVRWVVGWVVGWVL